MANPLQQTAVCAHHFIEIALIVSFETKHNSDRMAAFFYDAHNPFFRSGVHDFVKYSVCITNEQKKCLKKRRNIALEAQNS